MFANVQAYVGECSGNAVLLVQVPGLYWACRVSRWSLQTHGQWPAQGGTVVTTRGSYPTIPGACTAHAHLI